MEEAKKRNVSLNPNRKVLAESARNVWVVNAEAGTTLQDVLQPAFWAHCASTLRPYDHIEVRLETGEWVAELMVLSQGLTWAKVHVMHHYDLAMSQEAPPESQKHQIKWRGPHLKWSVIRIADSSVLQEGMEKEQAQDWLRNYERTVAVT